MGTKVVTVSNEGTGEVRGIVVVPQAGCRQEVVEG
jgi:hypothetical protein